MKLLSHRQSDQIAKSYRNAYGLDASMLAGDGRLVPPPAGAAFLNLPLLMHARRDALQESVRWGEPYLYFPAPGLMSWVVPLVNGHEMVGGLSGGEVIPDAAPERQATCRYLSDAGARRQDVEGWLRNVPLWPQRRTREAAEALFRDAYLITGFKPELLRHHRDNALQQRQIAETIHEMKEGAVPPPLAMLHEEQMLLSLVRVGDLTGARRVLNDMLARIFLYSPRMPLVQARVIEMLGYLVRAAVEDNPMLEPLLERHLGWIEKIVATREFEPLCMLIRGVLDDFMDVVRRQGFNRSSRHVRTVLDHLAQQYAKPVTLDALAKLTGLNRFHLSRLVKATTGKSIPQHLRTLRIQAACRLLENGDTESGDIAYTLGFSDQSYFIKQFREVTGTTPKRYRAGLAPAAPPRPVPA
ncbi:MAG: helix-turn-helix domain-containing protein [bacterium]